LTAIVEQIERVADIVRDIAAASKEQSASVGEINNAVSRMDEMTQQNSALVEQSASASRTLQDQAQSLHDRMSFFTVQSASVVDRSRAGRDRR
jgi:methyl-accepting chemotaxis protein